jgi:hypothetical protein
MMVLLHTVAPVTVSCVMCRIASLMRLSFPFMGLMFVIELVAIILVSSVLVLHLVIVQLDMLCIKERSALILMNVLITMGAVVIIVSMFLVAFIVTARLGGL